jgi:hypothetical protein
MEGFDRAIVSTCGEFCLSETGEPLTEQRYETRHRLSNAMHVAFYNNSKLYRGYATDLSIGGARLRLPVDTPDGIPDFSRGRKMECYLLNRYGNSKCRGTIQWMLYDGTMLQWGISFIELSIDKDDPLRRIIDEVCLSEEFAPVIETAIY